MEIRWPRVGPPFCHPQGLSKEFLKEFEPPLQEVQEQKRIKNESPPGGSIQKKRVKRMRARMGGSRPKKIIKNESPKIRD